MQKKSRPGVHPQEVREQAIKLMDEHNFMPQQVGQRLNVPYKTVQAWQAQHRAVLPLEQLVGITETEKEVRRLQRRNAELEKENEFLKSVGVLCEGVRISAKYAHIQQHQPQYSLTMMCRVLNVSRSGYNAWKQRLNREPAPMKQRKQQRQAKVLKHFNEAFNHSAGYRKVQRDVPEDGIQCCEETIRRDYKELNIAATIRKKFKVRTTDSNHNVPISPNILDRDFVAEKPGEKMVTDITYVATREGFIYVTLVIDLFSRRVIGWSIEEAVTVDSVLKALKMALQKLLFFPPVMLLHSDRGSQYAACLFRQACRLAGIVQSMSRKGNCWDNAVAESVNGKLKTELLYRQEVFETKEAARDAVIEYIEGYYNSKRRHQTLNYRRPNEVWNEYFEKVLTDRKRCVKRPHLAKRRRAMPESNPLRNRQGTEASHGKRIRECWTRRSSAES